MSILSFEFLGFGLLLLLAYFSLPLKWRPWVLLTFSMAFVAFSDAEALQRLPALTPLLGAVALLLILYFALPEKGRPWGLLLFSAAFLILYEPILGKLPPMQKGLGGIPLLLLAVYMALCCLLPEEARAGWRKAQRWVLLVYAATVVCLIGGAGLLHLSVLVLIVWGGALALQSLRTGQTDAELSARKLAKSSPIDWADDAGWQAQIRAEGVLRQSAKRYETTRKWLLALLLVLDLGSMAFIKFYPTVAEWLNEGLAKGAPLPIWTMAVPLGLSYFTFQSAGYLIDVYRGKADAPQNPLRTLLFAGYFLQLPQGPISTWKELEPKLFTGHRLDPEKIASGFTLMIWGYFKKLVIADRLALIMNEALSLKTSLRGWLALGSALFYAIRLYADFSGGMDVVRGLSRMLGVELPENFRRPFFSTTVAEYWRRWHITLGAWFRSYLLYPLTTCKLGVSLGRGSATVLGRLFDWFRPAAVSAALVFGASRLWAFSEEGPQAIVLYIALGVALLCLLTKCWRWLRSDKPAPEGKSRAFLLSWGPPALLTAVLVTLACLFLPLTDVNRRIIVIFLCLGVALLHVVSTWKWQGILLPVLAPLALTALGTYAVYRFWPLADAGKRAVAASICLFGALFFLLNRLWQWLKTKRKKNGDAAMAKKVGRVVPPALATILVFLLIGIWHGLTLNAVYFGLYFGVLMALSTLLEPLWKWVSQTALRLHNWALNRLPGAVAPVMDRAVLSLFLAAGLAGLSTRWALIALYILAAIALCMLARPLWQGLNHFFRLARTWALVGAAQFFAFTPNTEKSMFMLEKTFTDWSFHDFASRCTHIMDVREWIILGSALVLLLAVDILCEWKPDLCDRLARGSVLIRWPLLILLILTVLVLGMYGEGYDSASFLYQGF